MAVRESNPPHGPSGPARMKKSKDILEKKASLLEPSPTPRVPKAAVGAAVHRCMGGRNEILT